MFSQIIIWIYRAIKKIVQPIAYRFMTPKWVRTFPYEMDKAGLTKLSRNTKGALHKPREMVYVLSGFRGKKSTENAVYTIEQAGWSCTVLPQQGAPGKCIIECKKDDYSLTEANYYSDNAFFSRIAKLYSAEHDGWYAGGDPYVKKSTLHKIGWAPAATLVLLVIGLRIFVIWHAYDAGRSAALQPRTPVASANVVAPDAAVVQQNLSKQDTVSALDPKTGLKTYSSPVLGVNFKFPDTMMLSVGQPCPTESAFPGNPECAMMLTLKDWQERYGPTITIERIAGTLSDAQTVEDQNMDIDRANDPTAVVVKENITVAGKPGVRYTLTTATDKGVYTYVQNGNKVVGILGGSPRSKPAGFDYNKILNGVIDSTTLVH